MEKQIQMSQTELKVIAKLLGNMSVDAWKSYHMDEYDIQVLTMTYRCLYEEGLDV